MNKPFVFLSYAREDLAHVLPIAKALSAHGVEVWDDRLLQAGTEWHGAIQEALEKADVFLLFTSPAFLQSAFLSYELGFALGRAQRGDLKIVAIRLGDAKVPESLNRFPALSIDGRRALPKRIAGTIADALGVSDSAPEARAPSD